MRFCVLGSGSKGNCTFIASGETSILIDAGFSGVEVERRLDSIGVKIAEIDAILITHAHGDHVRGAGILARRFHLPVFANPKTLQAAGKHLSKLPIYKDFTTGSSFKLNALDIHPFSTSHDCVDPVGFTISDGLNTVGYCTDTGMVSKLIQHRLSFCSGLVLECNHDLEMLKNGPYPLHVQQRVRSNKGHLATPQALQFLRDLCHDGLKSVVLAHISESNNCIDLINQAVELLLGELRSANVEMTSPPKISLAGQDKPGELIDLRHIS